MLYLLPRGQSVSTIGLCHIWHVNNFLYLLTYNGSWLKQSQGKYWIFCSLATAYQTNWDYKGSWLNLKTSADSNNRKVNIGYCARWQQLSKKLNWRSACKIPFELLDFTIKFINRFVFSRFIARQEYVICNITNALLLHNLLTFHYRPTWSIYSTLISI